MPRLESSPDSDETLFISASPQSNVVAVVRGGRLVFSQTLSPPIISRFKCLTNGCCDQHEWCRFWASIGECQVNEEWMAGNCQLACGTCTAPQATPADSTLCEGAEGARYGSTGKRKSFAADECIHLAEKGIRSKMVLRRRRRFERVPSFREPAQLPCLVRTGGGEVTRIHSKLPSPVIAYSSHSPSVFCPLPLSVAVSQRSSTAEKPDRPSLEYSPSKAALRCGQGSLRSESRKLLPIKALQQWTRSSAANLLAVDKDRVGIECGGPGCRSSEVHLLPFRMLSEKRLVMWADLDAISR
ncbi:unnamed protein product [Heligmosomoides polygyrus]|uniref:ShKT domain-containing protein n=1 Tax=Heligmosomoides polygyrus TaxID=6339 RepID=A0A183FG17_HELPZ|nr:unnamed protein product [Heligmosomoides polygyrus]